MSRVTERAERSAPTLADVEAARRRIADDVVYTPCTRSLVFEDLHPGNLYLKFENLQRTGSFKDRGALNRLLHLSGEERERGIITASAGNHAQAVAYHASRLGVPATVVMPETTPLIKVSNTRNFGAEVVLHGHTFDGAVEEAYRRRDEAGLTMVHAFNDEAIVAGQGTVGLELLEQVPEMETVLVPIGGGGLISGIGIALKSHRPEIRLVGVEAAACPSASAAREAGEIVEMESTETIAEGIAVKRIGDVTFPLIEEYVDDIAVVEESAVANAVLQLLEREKTVVEGAGATVLAAVLSGEVPIEAEETAVMVLSGGNIDVNMISRIIALGLVSDGRLARLIVKVQDRPGSLARLTKIVAEKKANVLEIAHKRAFADISAGEVEIAIMVETRGREHVEELIAALEAEGHQVEMDMGRGPP